MRKRLGFVLMVVVALLATALPAAARTMAPEARTAVRPVIFPVIELQRYRDNWQECRDGCRRLHEGIDVFGPRHSPLVATRDATVVRAVSVASQGGIYGNNVLLRDADGWYYSYSHLNNDNFGTDDGRAPRQSILGPGIQEGAKVQAGQIIGYVGDSGNSEGSVPHLHFEIWNSDAEFINPYRSLVNATRLSAPVQPGDVPVAHRNYVSELGKDFLGGPFPDVQRAKAYDQLRYGGGRERVVADLPRSFLWVATEVIRTYRIVLGREPDPDGLRFWIGQVLNGMGLVRMQSEFYGSAEYVKRAGSDGAWIDRLYLDLVDRRSDPAGKRYWLGTLAAGASRVDIAYSFVQSLESRRVRVVHLYEKLLHRGPDRPGREYWAAVLAVDDDLALASFLAASEEYYQKAQ